MAQAPNYTLLAADGDSAEYTVQGTIIQVMIDGSLGGGSFAVELKSPRGTWVPLCDDANTAIALTIQQAKNIELPPQSVVKLVLSGATAPDVGVKIQEISDGRTQY
jgi:hypothetical protein